MSLNKRGNNSTENFYALIRKNSFYIIIERSIVPIINFLITVFIIRKLTVNDYGIYNILLAIMGYVSLLASLGIPSVFQRFIPEFYEKKQMGNVAKLVGRGLLWRLILSGGIVLIMIAFSTQIGDLFKFKDALRYLTIFAIAIIFYLQSGLLTTTLTSLFRHQKYVIAQISYVIFRGLILFYILNVGKGLAGLLIAESVSFLFLFTIQFVFYRRFLSVNTTQEKTEFPVKRLLRFGGFSYLNEVGAQILAVSTDFFIIAAFLGPVAVGIYAFANRIMKTTLHILPHSMLVNVIRPAFFTKFTQNKDPGYLNNMYNFLLKISAFFTFPLIVGLIVLGDKLIMYVYDPKYINAFTVLWIVATFNAINAFLFPLGLVTQAIERVEINFYSKIFAVYNLILDLIVVRPYGVIGIAIVTGSAVLFKNIFIFIFARRYTPLTLCWWNLVLITINSLIMGSLLFLFRFFITNIYSLILTLILGIIIYFTIAYFNKVFNKDERKIMNKILPRPVFVF